MTFEDHSRTAVQVKPSSDRTLGLVFAGFFFLAAVLPLLRGHAVRGWAVATSAGFLLIALTVPRLLGPLNRVWTALGAALHRITNPLVLGAFFYGVFTPFGWVLRLLGKDFLRLRYAPDAASYWIPRASAPSSAESMKNQY